MNPSPQRIIVTAEISLISKEDTALSIHMRNNHPVLLVVGIIGADDVAGAELGADIVVDGACCAQLHEPLVLGCAKQVVIGVEGKGSTGAAHIKGTAVLVRITGGLAVKGKLIVRRKAMVQHILNALFNQGIPFVHCPPLLKRKEQNKAEKQGEKAFHEGLSTPFAVMGKNPSAFLAEGRKLGRNEGQKVGRAELKLGADFSCGNKQPGEVSGTAVYHGRKGFFHADGGTAAAYIAG